MPLHDYRCTECYHEFETISKGENELPCEKCTCIAVKSEINYLGDYQIKGDNSASTRPRRVR